MIKISLLCLLFISNSWAILVDHYENSSEVYQENANETERKHKEIYLKNESLLSDTDTNLGTIGDEKYTGNDRNRLSFAYHFSTDYQNFTKLMSIDIQYLYRLKHYQDLWIGFQYKNVSAQFDAMASNHTENSSSFSKGEDKYQRGSEEQSSHLWGAGIGHRFKFLPIEHNRLFESVNLFLNYHQHQDSFTTFDYTGYGFNVDYAINYRIKTNFFIGGKLSYHLAEISREAQGDESVQRRSLLLSWTSLAFEMGYFY
jgi:hypothetical protein